MTYELHRDRRSTHQRIAAFLRELRQEPILDVGASIGQLARSIEGSGLVVDAVEPDQASADAARPYYRSVAVGPIERVELPSNTYRVVVCADVLEHTADPLAVIARLRETSTDDATFVISLPNVGHLAARAIVLAGHFPQQERGIFDRTHLHFFTRSTALELMRAAELQVERLAFAPVPLEVVWPRSLPRGLLEPAMRLQMLACRVRPTLFAFQWIIVARAR